MLQKLSDHVVECLARAAQAERQARASDDPAAKADFLDMARRWNALAESMQFVDKIDQFLLEVEIKRRRD